MSYKCVCWKSNDFSLSTRMGKALFFVLGICIFSSIFHFDFLVRNFASSWLVVLVLTPVSALIAPKSMRHSMDFFFYQSKI